MRATMALLRDIARELKSTGTYRSFTRNAMTFAPNETPTTRRGAMPTPNVTNCAPN